MKPMLEGEFRRWKLAVWLIRPTLITIPVALLCWAALSLDHEILIIASAILVQNAFALWIIGRTI